MTKKTCYGNGRAASDPHRDESKISRGEANQATKHGQSSSCPHAAKTTWKKRYLTCLSKFQNKVKHKIKPVDAKPPASFFKQRNLKRCSPVLEGCSNLVRVVRRTAAGCFAAVASGAGEDELPSYVQLDQVVYGVKGDAFGPVYLVT